MKRFAIVGIIVSLACVARADVKLPAIFGDHMVVQRGMKAWTGARTDHGEDE